MSNIRVNGKTGQIAIAKEGAGPQKSNVEIIEPGFYKVNLKTNQIAIPSGSGYEIHDLTQEQMNSLQSPESLYRRQAGGFGMISEGTPNVGLGESTLRGFQQGVTLGTSDEISGATQAALAAMTGENVPDQQNPVTGGAGGAGQAYLRGTYEERAANEAAKASNPKAYKGAFFGGAMLPGMAMPANTMRQAAMAGGTQGALLGGGLADSEDPTDLLLGAGLGGAGGAVGGMLLKALYNMAFVDNSAAGLAYRALDDSAPGQDIMNIRVRPGSAPAELDPGMSDLLRTAGSMNGPRAAEAIPAAQQRVGDVNQAIINQVNQQLSPDDAALYLQRIQQQAQQQNQAAYAAANASPTRVGLTPDITQRPSFQNAMVAANAAAGDEMPPRLIDPTDLGVRDIDLIDRVLQSTQRAATESRGDTSPAAQTAKALIPTRGEVASTVRTVADQAFPELAQARTQAAQSFAVERAVETGGRWLTSSTSPEEVATQFAAMPAQEQQAALAAFATDIRNALGTKTVRANLGNFFEKNAVAQKLQAVGVPDEIITRVVEGGQGARAMLNALQGGSMTARNIAGKEALQSTLSQVKPSDFMAGAFLGGGNPMTQAATTALFPITRAIGSAAERDAAGLLIDALTTPGAAGITGLINRAPQTWSGMLTAPGRVGGSLLGSEIAGAR